MEPSGWRCFRAHMVALFLEIFQGPRLTLTFCSAFPGYGPYLLDPRCLTATFLLKTARGRKGRKRGQIPPFRDVTQICTHGFCSCCIGQVFPHKLQGRLENAICICVSMCQGLPLWKRRGDSYWSLTNRPDEQVWGETSGRPKLLAWECRKGYSRGVGSEPGNEKSGCSFSRDFISNSLVLWLLPI